MCKPQHSDKDDYNLASLVALGKKNAITEKSAKTSWKWYSNLKKKVDYPLKKGKKFPIKIKCLQQSKHTSC